MSNGTTEHCIRSAFTATWLTDPDHEDYNIEERRNNFFHELSVEIHNRLNVIVTRKFIMKYSHFEIKGSYTPNSDNRKNGNVGSVWAPIRRLSPADWSSPTADFSEGPNALTSKDILFQSCLDAQIFLYRISIHRYFGSRSAVSVDGWPHVVLSHQLRRCLASGMWQAV